MPQFLVAKSRQCNGLFDIHRADCAHAPPAPHSHLLGSFPTAARAVGDARALYPRCAPCEHCCPVMPEAASGDLLAQLRVAV